MSRTLAHSPTLADGPRRAPRRPRYADQRASERQQLQRTIADMLSGRTIADILTSSEDGSSLD